MAQAWVDPAVYNANRLFRTYKLFKRADPPGERFHQTIFSNELVVLSKYLPPVLKSTQLDTHANFLMRSVCVAPPGTPVLQSPLPVPMAATFCKLMGNHFDVMPCLRNIYLLCHKCGPLGWRCASPCSTCGCQHHWGANAALCNCQGWNSQLRVPSRVPCVGTSTCDHSADCLFHTIRALTCPI